MFVFVLFFSLAAVPGMTSTVALILDAARIFCRLLSMFSISHSFAISSLDFSLSLSLWILFFCSPSSQDCQKLDTPREIQGNKQYASVQIDIYL